MQVIQVHAAPERARRPPLSVIGGDDMTARLRRDVAVLSEEIGERNLRDADRRRALDAAREYIAAELAAAGHSVRRQSYVVAGSTVENLEVEIRGTDRATETVVVGAHYDTAKGTPGANDNASGVAALLSLARSNPRRIAHRRTLRLVAFCTEEPPFTRTPDMGSSVYARACRRRGDVITAMLSLEMLGYYSDSHRAEHAPFPLNIVSPWRPDFLAVIGNLRSRDLVKEVARAFTASGQVRCKGVALPGVLPGVKSSDQWSFWKEGYCGAMLTDTAWLRYRHYHRTTDTLDKLDFVRLARVTVGITSVVDRLAMR